MSVQTIAEHISDPDERADLLRTQSRARVVYVVADSERRTATKAAHPVIAALMPTKVTLGLPVLTVSDVQAFRVDLSRPALVILTAKAASILRANGRPMHNAVVTADHDHDPDALAADAVRHGAQAIAVMPEAGTWLRDRVEAAWDGAPLLAPVVTPPTVAEVTARQLLAKVEEWSDDRADLSAAEGAGTADADDWHASDDTGCDLAARLADVVTALLAERDA